MNSCLHSLFLAFDTLNSKLSPGFRLSDKFSSYFSFHQANCKNKESRNSHLHKLDNLFDNLMMDSNTIIIIFNASLKNNVSMSISYIHSHSEQVKKMVYHTVNIMMTDAELFAIRYEINQAIIIPNTSCIVVITDTIHSAQQVFDLSVYLF